TVSVAQAVFDGSITIEGELAELCSDVKQAFNCLEANKIPVLVDPNGKTILHFNPVCVVDAIMAKRNLGTKIDDAPLVIAIGPGFEANKDCDFVIETKRGHNLGRIITEGSATENTGIPGIIAGYGRERVVHSPAEGLFTRKKAIGDLVKKGDLIAMVGSTEVFAPLDGKLRGLLNDGLPVPQGFKIADVDPRAEEADHTTVSDKALAIGAAVVTALDGFLHRA
ncbi:MAG: EF2563 family selenium-dependent molybdenum hydroxylase system protein, partial [Spirochaetia bacterium]|nr:EF2563 family selenium-dependent molybdenum hydroxylase system protein [Spirochaetia bacterium]